MNQDRAKQSANETANSINRLIELIDLLSQLVEVLSVKETPEILSQLQDDFAQRNLDLIAGYSEFETHAVQIPELKGRLTEIRDYLETEDSDAISIQYLTLLHSEIAPLNKRSPNLFDWIPRIIKEFGQISSGTEGSKYMANLGVDLFNVLHNCSEQIKSTSQKLKELEVFRHFRNVDSNFIVIGANGSGKSTFSRRARRVLGNSVVIIPAQKVFSFEQVTSIPIGDSAIAAVQQKQSEDKLGQGWNAYHEIHGDSQNLVKAMLSEHNKLANRFYSESKNGKPAREDSVLERAIETWNGIISHRRMWRDETQIWVCEPGHDKYEFPMLSDGEKAILYYVGHVLLAKPDSYIVIDEPENDLHAGVVTKLWNTLEDLRADCRFIYLTHNLNFASSRTGATKLWARGYHHPDFWDVQQIPELDSFPENLTMELLGSRQPILFCEGSSTSWDYKLYTLMFPEYAVKPVDGHQDVINHTRAFNKSREIHGNKAIGVIDGDWHSPEQIAAWQNDSVYCMDAQEVENLLCDEMLLEAAAATTCSEPGAIHAAKSYLFKKMREGEEEQALQYATQVINYSLQTNMLKKPETIAELKTQLSNCIDQHDVDELVYKRKAMFDQILEDQDFELAIRRYNNKGLVGLLGDRVVRGYGDRILRYLKKNPELLKSLRNKYFQEVPEIGNGENVPCLGHGLPGANASSKK